MNTSTVSSKGWIVIPAELRRKYHLAGGTQVQVVDYGGLLAIVPLFDDPVTEAAGMLEGATSLTETLLAEHAQELADERSDHLCL